MRPPGKADLSGPLGLTVSSESTGAAGAPGRLTTLVNMTHKGLQFHHNQYHIHNILFWTKMHKRSMPLINAINSANLERSKISGNTRKVSSRIKECTEKYIKEIETFSVFLSRSSYTSRSLKERERLWQHKSERLFPCSLDFSRVVYHSRQPWRYCFDLIL